MVGIPVSFFGMVYFQVFLLFVSRETNHPWYPLYPPINCDKSSTSSSSSFLFNRFPNFWYWLVVPTHPKNSSQIRKSSPSRDEMKIKNIWNHHLQDILPDLIVTRHQHTRPQATWCGGVYEQPRDDHPEILDLSLQSTPVLSKWKS